MEVGRRRKRKHTRREEGFEAGKRREYGESKLYN